MVAGIASPLRTAFGAVWGYLIGGLTGLAVLGGIGLVISTVCGWAISVGGPPAAAGVRP